MRIQPSIWAHALETSLDVPIDIQKERIERFVRFLQKKRMRKLLPLILRSLKARAAKDSIFVESAVPLALNIVDTYAHSLRSLMHAPENVQIQSSVNPDLYGGIKVTYNNYEYDASIRRHLETMEEQLWHQ
ncbi:hypothetical protein COS66_01570 [Candidatus Berkelbacteria bacterium CG06_land_8_20_14_3_00_43_10]|uniref:Uncharacterized protein n=1 Tax=Candidatus Berkelbacteria bacterium CG10_big_fil_rev_8_21_14_0_10_43_14 TaxID=1974515 RepID=A0A2M6R9R4_9BACT|nr:MAG: hypothetical protein AUK41_02640 [Candidatus Berkelbacteria bacterium CG2_30_43_20]PIS07227.1 MAG: hypothetical protein COT79_00400 [Candidatus Berkelbacteria bacterium CG10_big_fil_rev_8_21_14_0_10_43_14]PIU87314.1 MAG: hypothetical protein COS66_01570 [Candidatus Berkelbacteria bacterium CG06_land_8_20_14_3_00_43_10]